MRRWKVWWKRPPGACLAVAGLAFMALACIGAGIYFVGAMLVDWGIEMMEDKP